MADTDKYIDLSVGSGGSGTTGSPYGSFAAFNTGEAGTIGSGDRLIAHVKGSGSFSSYYEINTTDWTITGDLIIQCDNDGGSWDAYHDGVVGGGAVFTCTNNYASALTIKAPNVTVTGLEIHCSATTQAGMLNISDANASGVVIDKCILRQTGAGAFADLVYLTGSDQDVTVKNCLILVDSTATAYDVVGIYGTNRKFYNNTIINNGSTGGTVYGINITGLSPYVKNNIVQGMDSDINGTSSNTATNLTSDTTGDITSTTLTFASVETDYHLAAGDTAAMGVGTDLSGVFTDDVDENTRPTGGSTWDVGWHEYQSGTTVTGTLDALVLTESTATIQFASAYTNTTVVFS